MSWEGDELGDASLFPLPPQKNEDGDPFLGFPFFPTLTVIIKIY